MNLVVILENVNVRVWTPQEIDSLQMYSTVINRPLTSFQLSYLHVSSLFFNPSRNKSGSTP